MSSFRCKDRIALMYNIYSQLMELIKSKDCQLMDMEYTTEWEADGFYFTSEGKVVVYHYQ